MPANYVLLEKITVGAAGASSVTFSGIPQTGYTDLVVKATTRDTVAGANNGPVLMKFNGSATSDYSFRQVIGSGSAASSQNNNTIAYVDLALGSAGDSAGNTASTFTNIETYIPNYTSANYKSFSVDMVGENNATAAYAGLVAGLRSNTAAITSITMTANTLFAQYSTFYLYGVAKLGTTPAIVPYATGGDTIMTDGTYWYHAFTASGTFTPQKGLSCDVLVVAGGGSGGSDASGGGGAGGVIAFASQSLSTAQTVTIGAGGAGNTTTLAAGNNGSNSTFASLTAAVGGGKGNATANADGGSGGGTRNASGGAATSGQGNIGGGGVNSGTFPAGGGGGAGGAGSAGVSSAGGAGGAGTNSVTNWGALSSMLTATGLGVSGYIAGGGGGGTASGTGGAAGSGGASAGVISPNTTSNATANTGSGSGGAGDPLGRTGSGGSGLVIVRYAV